MRDITTLRLDFAAQLKIEAQAFIKFLNIEAQNERDRAAKAAEASKDWLTTSASGGFSAYPGSLSGSNTVTTETSYKAYTESSYGSYESYSGSYESSYSGSSSYSTYGSSSAYSGTYATASTGGMSTSTYGAASGGTGNYGSSGSSTYTYGGSYGSYGFKELEKTENELE